MEEEYQNWSEFSEDFEVLEPYLSISPSVSECIFSSLARGYIEHFCEEGEEEPLAAAVDNVVKLSQKVNFEQKK